MQLFLKDSGIAKENTDYDRVGIFVSSGIGGLSTIQEQCEINYIKGNNRVSPMFIPMAIANMPAGNIAIEFGFKGESVSIVTACASSTHAIGEAYKTIKYGYEDVIIAGGTEASICPIGIAGFENMKALHTGNDKTRASIPFDKERSGFVMGEGSGMVILEELEHAKARGAKIYAEIIGFGSTTVMISSTKGNIGHLLGAAGGVEAVLSVKAIENQLAPATINYREKDEECDLDIIPNGPRKSKINIVMSNSLGFGGHNACIIIKKFEN